MRPVHTDLTTTILGAPRDWDAEARGECEGLPIAVADGTMYSYWRLNLREWISVLIGRKIRLGIFGQGHPPVSLDTLT